MEVATEAPGHPVVVKQYGERRTGTNALRTFLMQSYGGVLVLMHVLGDKHSAPVDLGRLVEDAGRSPDRRADDVALVRAATAAAPAATTDEQNERQRALVEAVAPVVAPAVRAGTLRFLVSVRDPYTWLASVLAFEGFSPYGLLTVRTVERARVLCERANERHAAWGRLLDDRPDRSTVVRFEDLVADPTRVLNRLGDELGVVRTGAGGAVRTVDRRVEPAGWDHSSPELGGAWQPPPDRHLVFDACPSLAALATTCVDWSRHERFGYEPRRSATGP